MDGSPITRKELRDFGLIAGTLFALLFGIVFPLLRSYALPLWPWILGALLWVPALFRPALLEAVYAGWKCLGLILGWINSRVLLALIFYLAVAPIGLFLRIFGQDPMSRKFDSDVDTYRVVSVTPAITKMEKPY